MEELLQQIQYEDDQQAFKAFYKLLFFKLYQFAYSYLRKKETAEEVVNDVFLGLWQKRNTLNEIRNINVYLYVSVKNDCLNRLRKSKQALPLTADDLTLDHLTLKANPESCLITRELQQKIQAAIGELPPRCKLIFKMVKEDGLSYKEAAKILEISVKTVDAQLCVALRKLSQLLLPVWKEYKENFQKN